MTVQNSYCDFHIVKSRAPTIIFLIVDINVGNTWLLFNSQLASSFQILFVYESVFRQNDFLKI